MTLSIASMSNASSYTLDLKESLKGAAATSALQLSNKNPTAHALSRAQLDFHVDRTGSNPSLPAVVSVGGGGSGGSRGTGSNSKTPKMKPWDKLDVTRSTAQLSNNNNNNSSTVGAKAAAATVSKSYSLPALTQPSNGLSKSMSGPALLAATFANSVNAHSKSKHGRQRVDSKVNNDFNGGGWGGLGGLGGNNGGGDGGITSGIQHPHLQPHHQQQYRGSGISAQDVPLLERAQEQVGEKQALARLIALRARRQEVREFLQSCSKSLHRGPWCRVKAR